MVNAVWVEAVAGAASGGGVAADAAVVVGADFHFEVLICSLMRASA